MNLITKLFKNNTIFIYTSDKMVKKFRKQCYNVALELLTKTIDLLDEIVSLLIQNKEYFKTTDLVNESYIMNMLSYLFEAQKQEDYILLADLFQIQVIPYVIKVQEFICINKELKWDEKKYHDKLIIIEERYPELFDKLKYNEYKKSLLNHQYYVEYSSSGEITLAIESLNGKKYMHSNYIPSSEADEIASTWYEQDKSTYSIFGLGMGYHVKSLINISEYNDIVVYESDLTIIHIALSYTDIGEIITLPNVKLIYEPDEKILLQKMLESNSDVIGLHNPTIKKISNYDVKEVLDDLFIKYDAIKRYRNVLIGNFNANIVSCFESVDSLETKFKGKNLYIVAAGPSLDKNFLELRNVGESDVVLSTGTVFKKLINAGIKPDYVIGIDPTNLIYKQIEGVEELEIPMIALSTVYKNFVSKYKGKKYIVFQKGFEKAEEYAQINNYNLYQTGGSVSTLALDIGIQFKCKKIVFIGLDLAFTNGYNHAKETPFVNNYNTDLMLHIEGVNGNLVPTSKNLNIYRKWIEERIYNINDIEIINATEGGANIKGMKNQNLIDVIKA